VSRVKAQTRRLYHGEAHVATPCNSLGHRFCKHITPDGTTRFLGIIAISNGRWRVISKPGRPVADTYTALIDVLGLMERDLMESVK